MNAKQPTILIIEDDDLQYEIYEDALSRFTLTRFTTGSGALSAVAKSPPDIIILALFHQIVEVWKFQKWAQPFVWIGMNAITIYLLSAFINFGKLADRLVGGDVAKGLGDYAAVVRSMVALGIMFAVVRFLYRRKIFLRL